MRQMRSLGPIAAAFMGMGMASASIGSGAGASDLEGVTLTFWTSFDEPPAIAAVIERFEQVTGVDVETVVLGPAHEAEVLSAWDQGRRPDVLTFLPDRSWMLSLDPTSTLVDLSDEEFVGRTLFGMADTAGRIGGGHYAAILGYPEVYGMLYGRQVAADAGFEIPTGIDALYDACGTYGASARNGAFVHIGGGRDIRGMSVLPTMLWADAVSGGLVDELDSGAATFTDPRIVEGINALNSASYRGCLNFDDFQTATYEDQLERVMDGSAAMIPQGISVVGDLVERFGVEAVDEAIGYFPLSFRTPRASWGARPDTAFLIPVNTDPVRQEAALALVRYALGEAYVEYLAASRMPPVLDGAELPANLPIAVREAHEAMLAGAAPAVDTAIQAPYGDLNQWLFEMLGGTRTPDDVAAAMAETFDRMTGG